MAVSEFDESAFNSAGSRNMNVEVSGQLKLIFVPCASFSSTTGGCADGSVDLRILGDAGLSTKIDLGVVGAGYSLFHVSNCCGVYMHLKVAAESRAAVGRINRTIAS